jgi:hypothetical protein
MRKITIFLILIFCLSAVNIALSGYACDPEKVEAVNEVKRTVENSLINAASLTKLTDSGIEIMAFYLDSRLIKISANNSLSNSEQIFFGQNTEMVYYEISGYAAGSQFFHIYYFSEGKLFCKENGLNGKEIKRSRKDGEKIRKILDEYLAEIQ